MDGEISGEEVEDGLDCAVVGEGVVVAEGMVDVERVVGDRTGWDKEVVSCAEEVAGRMSARKRSVVGRGRIEWAH